MKYGTKFHWIILSDNRVINLKISTIKYFGFQYSVLQTVMGVMGVANAKCDGAQLRYLGNPIVIGTDDGQSTPGDMHVTEVVRGRVRVGR